MAEAHLTGGSQWVSIRQSRKPQKFHASTHFNIESKDPGDEEGVS